MTKLPIARLKELLVYDPESGVFTRRTGVKGAAAGSVAGSKRKNGYVCLCVDYVDYLAHRLAWFYMTGSWPKQYIDHANGNPSDNRWSNLREATQTQQNANTRKRKDNTSGVKGVKWHSKCHKWNANICVNGVQKSLGLFDDIDSAARAYASAAKSAFGDFARLA
jgi:hypothetical protein